MQTERPSLGPGGRLGYQLPVLKQEFGVKASRLRFLSPDKRSITLDETSRCKGVELILQAQGDHLQRRPASRLCVEH